MHFHISACYGHCTYNPGNSKSSASSKDSVEFVGDITESFSALQEVIDTVAELGDSSFPHVYLPILPMF